MNIELIEIFHTQLPKLSCSHVPSALRARARGLKNTPKEQHKSWLPSFLKCIPKILWLDIWVFDCGRLGLMIFFTWNGSSAVLKAYWNEGCRVQVKADIGVTVYICAFVRISAPHIFSLGHCANKRWLAQEMLSRRRTPPGNTCFTRACLPFRTRCSWPDLHFLRLFSKLPCMFQLVFFSGRFGALFRLKFLYFCSCVRGCELESSRLLQQHPHHLSDINFFVLP